MEMSTCDIDAQLLEQFNALGTNDRDDLVNQLRAVLGSELSTDACRFFLELSGWNLQRAVGAYFDFSFENSPPAGFHSSNVNCTAVSSTSAAQPSNNPASFNVRIWPTPSGSFSSGNSLKVTVQNCGLTHWQDGFYLRSETEFSVANLASCFPGSRQLAWLPLGPEARIPLPPLAPSQFVELSLEIGPPGPLFSTVNPKPLVGGISFCLPTDEVFGETLYCTALPGLNGQSWVFQHGIPEGTGNEDINSPMEEA
ncbi:unnamed protein product [Calicophoron daubneyi]|uniref:Next to BRCA1 central domain-containing protein n=1 Tax=Calicophoron daubneyi TaxID=300641 RepID=A0AAV2TPI4_CALDB